VLSLAVSACLLHLRHCHLLLPHTECLSTRQYVVVLQGVSHQEVGITEDERFEDPVELRGGRLDRVGVLAQEPDGVMDVRKCVLIIPFVLCILRFILDLWANLCAGD